MKLPGRATPHGTSNFLSRFPTEAKAGHFRQRHGLWLSSLGIGTYLGQPDDDDDAAYSDAIARAVQLGTNVIDTAINYRHQRSERAVGTALKRLHAQERAARDQLVICTKAGFLTPGAAGSAPRDQVAGGMHCIAPEFLEDQIDRSLENMDLECIDVFYLHNPETQLTAVERDEFMQRLRRAFEMLERKADEGKIQFYGTATWSGYRVAPDSREHLALADIVAAARDAGGDGHRFRFVQAPFNLAMTEALTSANQAIDGRRLPLLQAANELGVTMVSSASLMQAHLALSLPEFLRRAISGVSSDAERALQFARSAPGVTVALVGMKTLMHVEQNLRLAALPPISREQFGNIFQG